MEPDYWQPHDREFHAISREGWCGGGYGGTFPHEYSPPPAVRGAWPGPGVPLPAPERLDYDLDDLLAKRRSRRDPKGCTTAQLATYLDLLRIRRRAHNGRYEALHKRVPGAGGMHHLEAYAVVWGCQGLSRGVWHYNAEDGLAYKVRGTGPEYMALLDGARSSAGVENRPAVLLVLASRIARLQWKYERMAYRAALLDVGVVFGNWSLVTTALDLNGHPLGGGDSELWARATGLDPWAEPSVGEYAVW